MIISKKIYVSRIFKGSWRSSLFIIGITTLTYLINEYLIEKSLQIPAFTPSILGTALAFFIGFNNNQAYDRWWEGRKIWGSIVNNSRTWARQIINYTQEAPNINPSQLLIIKKNLTKRHIAFLYALKESLRGTNNNEFRKYLSKEEASYIESKSNRQNAILDLQTKDIQILYNEGSIDGFKFIELNKVITDLCNDMGKSERIKNTVFPTTYSYYTNLFIWIFIIFVTMVTDNLVGIWSIVISLILGYVFMVSHSIGRALLNPFDNIITGVPLNQITRTIEINLLESLGEKDIPNPIEPVDNEYIM